MELARKVTPKNFLQVIGFSFDDYCRLINEDYYSFNPSARGLRLKPVSPELKAEMVENEFIQEILNFMRGYDIPVGDLMKMNSYGLVKRNGQDDIVMIDYGLNNSVWQDYYN